MSDKSLEGGIDPQEARHEAKVDRTPNLGDLSASGRKGAAKREANWQQKATQTREMLAVHAQNAVDTLGLILEGEGKDADKLKAAQLVLDRIGVGPMTRTEVELSGSEMLLSILNERDG